MNKTAAVIGGGTIGAGWAARLVLNGWRVQVYDANPNIYPAVQETLTQARTACGSLVDAGDAKPQGELVFCASQDISLQQVSLVVESLPENLDLKRNLYQAIEPKITPDCLIFSSTSGFKPSDLGTVLVHQERFFVCHPFNPVYLLPLVEVVPHPGCDQDLRERCLGILRELGMRPLLVRKEIDGHIADRLLEAMWREALWLIHDDIATTEEIDDAIKYGFGLRMAQMGLFETYRLGGGAGGFEAFLAQFGPALQWPWSHLTDVPNLDAALVRKIADQSDAQTGDQTHEQQVRNRDRKLVAILNALSE